MHTEYGKLYLIPTTLGDGSIDHVLPSYVQNEIRRIKLFIAENEKTTRHFIKKLDPEIVQSELQFSILNKRTTLTDIPHFLDPCKRGIDVGLLSEAGCPGVADPGAKVVKLAHQQNIQVVPLVGPSSILLAMMASGLNGQNFAFHGYLPIDKNERKSALKDFERTSLEHNQAQIFIETPYRNEKLLEEFKKHLHPQTKLCIASNITLPDEYIKTLRIKEWRKEKVDLHKKPTIYIFQKEIG